MLLFIAQGGKQVMGRVLALHIRLHGGAASALIEKNINHTFVLFIAATFDKTVLFKPVQHLTERGRADLHQFRQFALADAVLSGQHRKKSSLSVMHPAVGSRRVVEPAKQQGRASPELVQENLFHLCGHDVAFCFNL
jgi:hypothetical protein